MQFNAVIGALFGDEGKGLVVDYLAKEAREKGVEYSNQMVVRFCGGPQSAHTVKVDRDREPFVFHMLGSAALRGVHTMLLTHSEESVLIDPHVLVEEYKQVDQLGRDRDPSFVMGNVMIDALCDLIVPTDVALNRYVTRALRANGERVGTCGMGINEARQRIAASSLRVRIGDVLSNPDQLARFLDPWNWSELREYIKMRLAICNVGQPSNPSFVEVGLDYVYSWTQQHAHEWRNAIHWLHQGYLHRRQHVNASELIVIGDLNATSLLQRLEMVTFEGTQGLMLDKQLGRMPFVTNGCVGAGEAVLAMDVLCDVYMSRNPRLSKDPLELDVYYVTRSVPTRHGDGPLISCVPHARKVKDETNQTGEMQGALRYADLDLNQLAVVTCADFTIAQWYATSGASMHTPMIEVRPRMVVTHMDLVVNPAALSTQFIYAHPEGQMLAGEAGCQQLVKHVEDYTGFKVELTSYGPCADDVRRVGCPAEQTADAV